MSTEVSYTLKESDRARRIRVAVYKGGEVVVVKPKDAKQEHVLAFVKDKEEWIREKVEQMQWGGDSDLNATDDYHFIFHKPTARQLVEQKIEQWNVVYQFPYRKIEIKKMRSRWGSCSGEKVLCFNYKILFLSPELQDYLVVHELCHLAEMNHSARFWKQVERGLPNYRKLKKLINI